MGFVQLTSTVYCDAHDCNNFISIGDVLSEAKMLQLATVLGWVQKKVGEMKFLYCKDHVSYVKLPPTVNG